MQSHLKLYKLKTEQYKCLFKLPFLWHANTSDRGKEFACYQDIIDTYGISVYFADHYSAWQRGTNENSNGLLREFFPKKTDLAKISEDELVDALLKINGRPRKCLDWKTPLEVLNTKCCT